MSYLKISALENNGHWRAFYFHPYTVLNFEGDIFSWNFLMFKN